MNSLTGSYIGIAGLVVLILNHFGINLVSSDVESIIGILVTLYGAIHQAVVHNNLASRAMAAGVK